jgi:hypothetical protein
MDPRFLYLDISCMEVSVNFTPRCLWPSGKFSNSHWIGRRADPRNKLKFLTLPGLEFGPLGLPIHTKSLHLQRYGASS